MGEKHQVPELGSRLNYVQSSATSLINIVILSTSSVLYNSSFLTCKIKSLLFTFQGCWEDSVLYQISKCELRRRKNNSYLLFVFVCVSLSLFLSSATRRNLFNWWYSFNSFSYWWHNQQERISYKIQKHQISRFHT